MNCKKFGQENSEKGEITGLILYVALLSFLQEVLISILF